jgi:tRNA(fMet)-specific endonuclease VapC
MIGPGANTVDRLVLDTSAYSHLRAGHGGVLDIVAGAAVVLVPVVVIGELEAAFRGGAREQENRVALTEFLAEPFVSVLDVTRRVATRYGAVHADLRRAGTPIPANDIWIAALALDSGGHLLTFDHDFSHVDGLPSTILAA